MNLLNAAIQESVDEAEEDHASPGVPFVLPCFTTKEYEAERDLSRQPMFMLPERRWLAALLDAIGSPVFTDAERKVALWHTLWGQGDKCGNSPEHIAYVAHIKSVLSKRMPWLTYLLDGARAIVGVSPGTFTFVVENYQGVTFDVPELIPYTHLVPWATAEDRKRVN
jgi:hypothetical protein